MPLSLGERGARRPITGVRKLTGDQMPTDLTNSAGMIKTK
jgi:hypothetical protein